MKWAFGVRVNILDCHSGEPGSSLGLPAFLFPICINNESGVMDWKELLMLDYNEKESRVKIPVICDANVSGETAEEFYNDCSSHSS